MPRRSRSVNRRVRPFESEEALALAYWLRTRQRRARVAVHSVYQRAVEQARDPVFFTDFAVPDTLDGRFEVLAMHIFLLLNRLKGDAEDAAAFAQSLFDTFFADMDRSLREMGAGDLGVGRRVRTMAESFYGRIAAYDRGLGEGDTALVEALKRNLYGTVPAAEPMLVAAMARYIKRQRDALASAPTDQILRGEIEFLGAARALRAEGVK